MNGFNKLAADRLRDERHNALAACEQHLVHALHHLRSIRHYSDHHGFQLELPSEKQITDAMSQCARIHQLDKEQAR